MQYIDSLIFRNYLGVLALATLRSNVIENLPNFVWLPKQALALLIPK